MKDLALNIQFCVNKDYISIQKLSVFHVHFAPGVSECIVKQKKITHQSEAMEVFKIYIADIKKKNHPRKDTQKNAMLVLEY